MRASIACVVLLLKLVSSQVEIVRNDRFSPGTQMMQYCVDQVGTIQFDVTRHLRGTPGAVANCGCVQYEVCMKLTKLGANAKISHTCVKPPNTCNLPDGFAGAQLVEGVNPIDECQSGQAGDTLYFLLKDADSCIPTNPIYPHTASKTLNVLSVSGSGTTTIQADCRPFDYWAPDVALTSCAGAGQKECVWRVQLPGPDDEALCGGPGVSIQNRDWPSPSTSPSPPECKCAPDNLKCFENMNELVNNQGYLHTTILDCTDPDAIAADINKRGIVEGREYGCERSLEPGCNTIACQSFVYAKDYPANTQDCPLPEWAMYW